MEIRELCLVAGKMEGLDFLTEAVPVAGIGAAAGPGLDVLLGARAAWSSGRSDRIPETARWLWRG